MKKLVFLFLSLVFAAFFIKAQDCDFYFPYTEGSEVELTHFDKKDKLQGVSHQKVKEINPIVGGTEIKVENYYTDKKNEIVGSGEFFVKCINGIYYVDMTSYLGQESLKAYKDLDVQIKGDVLDIPNNPKPGEKLKDGTITIKVQSPGMSIMDLNMQIRNRKVDALETITTPAGTFNCIKISYNSEMKMIATFVSSATEWYAKGVGLVKSETFDKNGKISGHTLLTKITK